MTDPKPQETQQELFTEFAGEAKPAERIPPLAKTQKPILFSTTIEHLLLAGIVCILVLCFVFFLGVLRGKTLSKNSQNLEGMVAPMPAMTLVSKALETKMVKPLQASPPLRTATTAAPVHVVSKISKTTAVSPPAPHSQVAVSDEKKPYTIQLVTHKKKEYAENEVKILQKNGFYSFIIPSGDYYQVCAGQYAAKEEAKKDLASFGQKYKDCFLRRR